MRKTNENKTNNTKNCGSNESKNVKNCGGKGCDKKSSKNCK